MALVIYYMIELIAIWVKSSVITSNTEKPKESFSVTGRLKILLFKDNVIMNSKPKVTVNLAIWVSKQDWDQECFAGNRCRIREGIEKYGCIWRNNVPF